MSTRRIIQIPHASLRKVATPITEYSEEVAQLADSLQETLAGARKPRGVGLASTQIDVNLRMFVTKLDGEFRVFINPIIDRHSTTLSLGADPSDPDLEGCLSIPKLYGPVPRYQWIHVHFLELRGNKLVERSERFENFEARVIQHERDHLDGILFIDYSLEYDLPVYENVDKMIPIPGEIVQIMVKKSWENSESTRTP